jgi:hypothetical protein
MGAAETSRTDDGNWVEDERTTSMSVCFDRATEDHEC